MSIFTKQHLIESHPAYEVFLREPVSAGYVEITSDDILGLAHPRGYYNTYRPGSVVSYALAYNECPIEAVSRARANKQQLHWINARASVISSDQRPKENIVAVSLGMRVRFEGLVATIEADHNNNLKFVPVK